jgi:hypothetical protein
MQPEPQTHSGREIFDVYFIILCVRGAYFFVCGIVCKVNSKPEFHAKNLFMKLPTIFTHFSKVYGCNLFTKATSFPKVLDTNNAKHNFD